MLKMKRLILPFYFYLLSSALFYGFAAVAAGSAATLNLTGVLVGGQIATWGTTLGVYGRVATGIGGSTAIAGGASVRRVGSQIIVDFLPASFLYRGTVERAVDGLMNYFNVPDRPRCVIK